MLSCYMYFKITSFVILEIKFCFTLIRILILLENRPHLYLFLRAVVKYMLAVTLQLRKIDAVVICDGVLWSGKGTARLILHVKGGFLAILFVH